VSVRDHGVAGQQPTPAQAQKLQKALADCYQEQIGRIPEDPEGKRDRTNGRSDADSVSGEAAAKKREES